MTNTPENITQTLNHSFPKREIKPLGKGDEGCVGCFLIFLSTISIFVIYSVFTALITNEFVVKDFLMLMGTFFLVLAMFHGIYLLIMEARERSKARGFYNLILIPVKVGYIGEFKKTLLFYGWPIIPEFSAIHAKHDFNILLNNRELLRDLNLQHYAFKGKGKNGPIIINTSDSHQTYALAIVRDDGDKLLFLDKKLECCSFTRKERKRLIKEIEPYEKVIIFELGEFEDDPDERSFLKKSLIFIIEAIVIIGIVFYFR